MQQEEGHGECDGPDVGKGEELPAEPGQEEAPGEGSEAWP